MELPLLPATQISYASTMNLEMHEVLLLYYHRIIFMLFSYGRGNFGQCHFHAPTSWINKKNDTYLSTYLSSDTGQRNMWYQRWQFAKGDMMSHTLLSQQQDRQNNAVNNHENASTDIRAMRWFFLVVVALWILTAIIGSIIAFCLTGNPLCLSGFSALLPPAFL